MMRQDGGGWSGMLCLSVTSTSTGYTYILNYFYLYHWDCKVNVCSRNGKATWQLILLVFFQETIFQKSQFYWLASM